MVIEVSVPKAECVSAFATRLIPPATIPFGGQRTLKDVGPAIRVVIRPCANTSARGVLKGGVRAGLCSNISILALNRKKKKEDSRLGAVC